MPLKKKNPCLRYPARSDQRLGHLLDISIHHTEYNLAWAFIGGDINISHVIYSFLVKFF